MKHWYPYSFHSVKFYDKHNIKICICLTTYLDLKFTELSGFIQRGRGGGAVADLGLVKGGSKVRTKTILATPTTGLTHHCTASSQQQRRKHKTYIPYFISLYQNIIASVYMYSPPVADPEGVQRVQLNPPFLLAYYC